jgi:hypothetical protein
VGCCVLVTLCYLENEHMLAKVWQWNVALGGLRLMVPTSLLEQVHEILSEWSPRKTSRLKPVSTRGWHQPKRSLTDSSLQGGTGDVRERCSQ